MEHIGLAGSPRNREILPDSWQEPDISRPSSPTGVHEARHWLLRGALQEHGDLLASVGTSLYEAAYQDHDALALVQVKQARAVVLDAIPEANDPHAINARAAR